MEEILHNAFDKIHADDETKKRIIYFLSYKMEEIEERRNIVLCIPMFLFIFFILFLFLILV